MSVSRERQIHLPLYYGDVDFLPSLLLLSGASSEQDHQSLGLCQQCPWLQCHETASTEMKMAGGQGTEGTCSVLRQVPRVSQGHSAGLLPAVASNLPFFHRQTY